MVVSLVLTGLRGAASRRSVASSAAMAERSPPPARRAWAPLSKCSFRRCPSQSLRLPRRRPIFSSAAPGAPCWSTTNPPSGSPVLPCCAISVPKWRRRKTARGAVEKATAAGSDYRVIFLNLTMPKLDGHAAFQGIRAELPAVPELLMSGYSNPQAERFFDLGGPVASSRNPSPSPSSWRKSSRCWARTEPRPGQPKRSPG